MIIALPMKLQQLHFTFLLNINFHGFCLYEKQEICIYKLPKNNLQKWDPKSHSCDSCCQRKLTFLQETRKLQGQRIFFFLLSKHHSTYFCISNFKMFLLFEEDPRKEIKVYLGIFLIKYPTK